MKNRQKTFWYSSPLERERRLCHQNNERPSETRNPSQEKQAEKKPPELPEPGDDAKKPAEKPKSPEPRPEEKKLTPEQEKRAEQLGTQGKAQSKRLEKTNDQLEFTKKWLEDTQKLADEQIKHDMQRMMQLKERIKILSENLGIDRKSREKKWTPQLLPAYRSARRELDRLVKIYEPDTKEGKLLRERDRLLENWYNPETTREDKARCRQVIEEINIIQGWTIFTWDDAGEGFQEKRSLRRQR